LKTVEYKTEMLTTTSWFSVHTDWGNGGGGVGSYTLLHASWYQQYPVFYL
jgi:hypothetical protein